MSFTASFQIYSQFCVELDQEAPNQKNNLVIFRQAGRLRAIIFLLLSRLPETEPNSSGLNEHNVSQVVIADSESNCQCAKYTRTRNR